MEDKLYFKSFAKSWINGLPIGNGRLAAMIWEDAGKDIISFNFYSLNT